MSASDLPGDDLVAIGLEDLAAGAETVPAPPNTVCTRCSPAMTRPQRTRATTRSSTAWWASSGQLSACA